MTYEEVPQLVEAFQVPFEISIQLACVLPLAKGTESVKVPRGWWIVKGPCGTIGIYCQAEFEAKFRKKQSPIPMFPGIMRNPWIPPKVDDFPPYDRPYDGRPTIIWCEYTTKDTTS
jgi:hypothetical protein